MQFRPPSAEILNRILRIRGRDDGTAFVVDRETRQYLVTAAHLLNVETPEIIWIFIDDNWARVSCALVSRNDDYDVAILRLPFFIDRRHLPINLSLVHIGFGQNVFFLGYPYGHYGTAEIFGEGRLPMPFVKRAALSMFQVDGLQDRMALDGMNNPGFSGGPMVFTTEDGSQNVGGMITGFKEEERVLDLTSKQKEDGITVYAQNTGIIYATSARLIVEMIDANPLGFEFSASD